jgi:hypothetical protein
MVKSAKVAKSLKKGLIFNGITKRPIPIVLIDTIGHALY